MKLQDAKENYYFYSGKTSEIVRQLGFAGIAIIWFFKQEINGKQSIPSQLIPITALIVIGLACDLLQYIIGTFVWGIYHRYKEKKRIGEDKEFYAPKQINWGTILLFWAKNIVMIIAYIKLIYYLTKTVIV